MDTGMGQLLAHAPSFAALNEGKANFDDIYRNPDPREYFRVLGGLDYLIPEFARGLFRSLIAARAPSHGNRPRVLDLGCSYGINAAMIRYPVDLHRLRRRYNEPMMQGLTPARLMALDRHYFQSWPIAAPMRLIGLDASAPAVGYASRVGLVDVGICADLERSSLTTVQADQVRDVDLILSTGCVGYVTQRTFRSLLLAQRTHNKKPWVANFVLRMFSYDDIAAELETFGLVTEKLEGVTFVQRRFHSPQEMETTLAAVTARGLASEGKEAEGLLHAELYVSRPAEDVDAAPLARLVSVTSGANAAYGRRYHLTATGPLKLI